mmetsp:Transcript_39553/g.99709  ORF Transcript_39553/g.99709 Transcript_39553/m.99709 type:complete len:226 (+) Transcript_39553:638-1315(+)
MPAKHAVSGGLKARTQRHGAHVRGELRLGQWWHRQRDEQEFGEGNPAGERGVEWIGEHRVLHLEQRCERVVTLLVELAQGRHDRLISVGLADLAAAQVPVRQRGPSLGASRSGVRRGDFLLQVPILKQHVRQRRSEGAARRARPSESCSRGQRRGIRRDCGRGAAWRVGAVEPGEREHGGGTVVLQELNDVGVSGIGQKAIHFHEQRCLKSLGKVRPRTLGSGGR